MDIEEEPSKNEKEDVESDATSNDQKLHRFIAKEKTTIKEGQAEIIYPAGNEVFYNPVQEVNRDLSIVIIKLFIEQIKKERAEAIKNGKKSKTPEQGIRILEALSASGTFCYLQINILRTTIHSLLQRNTRNRIYRCQ